ncbi:hypothetical protein [Thalassobius sp. I31.1]|uniref:hypothetical protein n=1 Tax=Thalassobius sp. I31.1 TaxID=2109912 RepID=UPI0018E59B8C|nr:hypothetical protein [Thalassobius sp. I31.1]
MNSTSIRPRPDQILELSRGLTLPLPPIDNTLLEIIVETFLRAFEDVCATSSQTAQSGTEAEVTALIQARLNEIADHDPFWGQLVSCIVRGAESLSFDGSHLEKRPDLSIYLTERSRNFPLVAEAKILDSSKGKTEKLYCENGIHRFLNGEYAWGTREALMVAYVRDGSSINSKLTHYLSSGTPRNSVKYAVETMPEQTSNTSEDIAISTHNRSFSYLAPNTPKSLPGPITLWHLWLH